MITVDAHGKILAVERHERIDGLAGVEFYNGILVPGFVNAHCHTELSYLQGALPPGGGLAAFAANIARRRNDPELLARRERAAVAFDKTMWQQGVSAVADICNGDSTLGMKSKSSIRYVNFAEHFGLNNNDLSRTVELCGMFRQAGLDCGVTPHAVYSLRRGSFAAAAGATPEHPLSIHFLEDPAERELFAGQGALAEWYRAAGMEFDAGGSADSPAARVRGIATPGRKILLVHNTFISEEEVAGLDAADVTFVLCPNSNKFITGQLPPVEVLRRQGVRIAVGTDSPASNPTPSMLSELGNFPHIPLAERLQWATLGGAQALGLESVLGSIEVGKSPGLTIISYADVQNLELTPASKSRRLV